MQMVDVATHSHAGSRVHFLHFCQFSLPPSLLRLPQVYPQFSSFLGKPTLRLDPFSKPASYNTRKGLDGVTSRYELCNLSP